MTDLNQFITTPQITLPDGRVFEPVQVGKYLAGKNSDGSLDINAEAKPWVYINYRDAAEVAKAAGLKLFRESLFAAIAYDASQQDINWTGGKVGVGKMFMGLHKGTVRGAQAATFESPDPQERRWFELSNGERIFDVAGNIFEYTFDDVQGDDEGLVAAPFAEDSISISLAPAPSMKKGVGWYPDSGNWSGYALVRGGCWYSDGRAGAFRLDNVSPDYAYGNVGFRLTK